MKPHIFLAWMVLVSASAGSSPEPDRSVQWGYRINYTAGMLPNDLRALRKLLQNKGIAILYPSQRDWKIPTGYLSVSSYLDVEAIKALSPWIASVESSEPTQRYLVRLRSGLNGVQFKKILQVFTQYKIQLMDRSLESDIPTSIAVKAALTPTQIKGIDEITEFIVAVERPQ